MGEGEVILVLDDSNAFSGIPFCRICHELEFESCKILEAPCSCSGTVKFAHRDCVQRWCNEKGNTICEICLQKFEPGYTVATKKAQLSNPTVTTVRRNVVEVPRAEADIENGGNIADEVIETECLSAADRSVSRCRLIALIFTGLLLVRHMLAVLTEGTKDCPFSPLTLLVIKATGILLPMYILLRIIALVQNNIRQQLQDSDVHR